MTDIEIICIILGIAIWSWLCWKLGLEMGHCQGYEEGFLDASRKKIVTLKDILKGVRGRRK